LNDETPLGAPWVFHVVPPFIVKMMEPVPVELWPAASQVIADTQAMPLTEEIPRGMLWAFQVVPLLMVPMTTPVPVPVLPTASQVAAEPHEIPLRT